VTEDRAFALVKAINSFGLATIGIGKPDVATLREVSLSEMMEAVAFVRLDDDTRPREADGTRRSHIVPDDRLVSAVYTLLHFHARDPLDDDDLVVGFVDEIGAHMLVVGVRDPSAIAAEAEEAA
jgi:hypothetical protein